MCNDRPGYSVSKSENRKQNKGVATLEGRGERKEELRPARSMSKNVNVTD